MVCATVMTIDWSEKLKEEQRSDSTICKAVLRAYSMLLVNVSYDRRKPAVRTGAFYGLTNPALKRF